MELSLHNNTVVLRLMHQETDALISLLTQLELLLTSYFADTDEPDQLFAKLDFGGREQPPEDSALARILPPGAADADYAALLRMLSERTLITEHLNGVEAILTVLNEQQYASGRLEQSIAQLQAEVAAQDAAESNTTVPNEGANSSGGDSSDITDVAAQKQQVADEIIALLANMHDEDFDPDTAAIAFKRFHNRSDMSVTTNEMPENIAEQMLFELIDQSHPVTVMLPQFDALLWAKTINILRIALADRLTNGGELDMDQARTHTEDVSFIAVYDWLGLFIDACSQALISLRKL